MFGNQEEYNLAKERLDIGEGAHWMTDFDFLDMFDTKIEILDPT